MATRDVRADFALEELFEALREQPEQLEGFYSTRELAKMMGRSEGWVLRRIAMAKEQDLLEVERASTETVDGRQAFKPVYRFKTKED